MMNDTSASLSDADLLTLVRDICSQSPTVGVTMVCGQIRARGYKVTRESVRHALRTIDPLSAALRWPGGLTVRRPYSVAGPNSLWHIGKIRVLVTDSYLVGYLCTYSCTYMT